MLFSVVWGCILTFFFGDQALALLQTRCLQHGIDVRWFKNTPPTPSFARHIYRYYIPFCKDAIAAAMAVGFVPYRIRTEGSTR